MLGIRFLSGSLIAGLAFDPCLCTEDIYHATALIVEALPVQPLSVVQLSEQNPDGL